MRQKNKFFIIFLSALIFVLFPIGIEAAVLYFLPQSTTIYEGDSFVVQVRIDTENEEINAIGGEINFPQDLLKILDLSKGGSVLRLWQKTPSVENGKISFIGGTPKAFKGQGEILKIVFLAEKLGRAKINFEKKPKVLLADGKGTEAKVLFLEGNYEIVERPKELPVISSKTHPDQTKWYKETTLHLHWDLIEGAEYSFLLSKDPLAKPDEIPDKPEGKLKWIGDMEYPDLEDGIYYFHLRQKLPDKDWSEKVTFRAMIDSTPPNDFLPKIGKDPSVFGGKYFLTFATTDETSGIDHYEISETRGKRQEIWKKAESPYLLEDQSLQSKILVKAVDKAGNERIVQLQPPKKPFPYGEIFLILIGIGIIWWIIKKSKIKFQKSK